MLTPFSFGKEYPMASAPKEPLYTAQQAAILFTVADVTIRTWCDEFAQHLSPTANPGTNRKRWLTSEDMTVFALISDLKKEGKTYQDIHAALDNGERGTPPPLEPADIQTSITTDHQRQLQADISRLMQELGTTRQELENAHLESQTLKDRIISLETEVRLLRETQQDAQEKQKRIEELQREIGRLEGKLAALKGEQ